MPVFLLLHGPDEFALAEQVAELKRQLGDPTTAALNTTVFDGRAVTLPELISTCNTLPFLASCRLVIVEGWLTRLLGKGDEAEAAGATAAAKDTLAALKAALPELPETTRLVFVERRALPASHPLLRAAAHSAWGEVKFFDVPKGAALVAWIQKRAQAAGGAFTREAAQALAAAETDPRALEQEILKLLAYVNYARPVDGPAVEALTPAGGEAKVFDLVDAVGQRRGAQAQRELHKLLEKEEPLYALSMITRQFRLMVQAKELLEARRSEADVAQSLSLHPFPAGKICAQARNFSLPALEHIYQRLLDYDTDIKTGRMEATVALDVLVASLAG